MGTKRKSDSISKDDKINFLDLSMAYGVQEDPPSIPKPRTTGSKASFNPFVDHTKMRSKDDDLHSKFRFANAMNQATRALDESARSMQVQNRLSSTELDRRCTPCKYADLDCNSQRPTCEHCRNLCAGGIIVPCLYTQDLGRMAEIPYGQASTLPAQSVSKEVEVIDLESDNDESPVDNAEEYEVEAIIARRSKTKKKGVEYLVKWKGYSTDANTWEPVSNLDGAQAFIDGFEAAIACTLPPTRKKSNKRPKPGASRELKRSPSLGFVVVPRNPKVLEHQTSRLIPINARSIEACRLVPADDTYEYLVDWHGLAPNQNSWEAETRFLERKSLIQDYHLATCLDFPSDDAVDTTDHSSTDRKLISAGIQVIVCSRRTGLGSRLTYCIYDKEQDTHSWIHASELVSDEAQTAILLFVMRSAIMQGYLEPHKALAINTALKRHGILGLAPENKTSSSIAANGQQSKAQDTRLIGMTPEISAVINHRLRTGKDTEYLVRWKHSQLNTWHSAEILSKLPDGILATRKYLETMQKSFVQRIPPVVASGDKSVTTLFQPVLEATTRETVIAGGTPFFRCCVECKKAGINCEGTTRCERCVTMNLTCVYAQPTIYERQAAEVWLRNQLSQQHSRNSPGMIDTSQSTSARRAPPPTASITSKSAQKTPNTFRIQSEHTPGKSSASNAVGHTPNYNSLLAVMNKSDLMATGAASDNIDNKPRRVRESIATPRQPKSHEVHSLTYADEKWINERISRMIATLSEEEMTEIRGQCAIDGSDMQILAEQKLDPLFQFLRSVAENELQTWKAGNRGTVSQMSNEKAREMSYAKNENGQSNQDSANPSIKSPGTLQQLSNGEQIENSSRRRKNRYYEELKDSFDSPRRSYPAEDSYLLVRKTDKSSRPLPHGHRNHFNVASNVLLAIGKHPWLPGLNHHLRGLLDRADSGKKINSVPAQVRNAENFKGHKAPASMSEMTEANFRATLPMGGKSF